MSNTLATELAAAAFETLSKEQPGAIAAIRGLLAAGETPARIHAAALKMSKGNQIIAGTFSHAAEYIRAQEESCPTS